MTRRNVVGMRIGLGGEAGSAEWMRCVGVGRVGQSSANARRGEARRCLLDPPSHTKRRADWKRLRLLLPSPLPIDPYVRLDAFPSSSGLSLSSPPTPSSPPLPLPLPLSLSLFLSP